MQLWAFSLLVALAPSLGQADFEDGESSNAPAPFRYRLAYAKQFSPSQLVDLKNALDNLEWKNIPVSSKNFRLQVGPYQRLELSRRPPKCLREILQVAEILKAEFPEFTFSVDGKIKNCKNLKNGVAQMLEHKDAVSRNILKFHSPLHTIYLTNKTKFNHRLLGHMGLYINIEREDEIKRRLISFEVGAAAIPHEETATL